MCDIRGKKKKKSRPTDPNFEDHAIGNTLLLFFWPKQTEKFTSPNKVLLVLGQRTGAHREDWVGILLVFPCAVVCAPTNQIGINVIGDV